MKTKFLLLVVIIITITACRKYPEGGLYFLTNMTKKIAGEYKFSHYYIDGVDSVDYFFNNDYVAYLELSGRDGNLPNRIHFYYRYNNNNSHSNNFGTNDYSWGWNNKNKTEIYIYLSDFSGRSVSSDTVINCGPFSSNTKSNWNILKLKDNELYIETDYNGKNYRAELNK